MNNSQRRAPSETFLEVRSLSKAFGGLVAVDKVSFVVPRGKIVAIIGPNGSGKTTIFNLISGLLPPTGGEIWFQGRKLNGHPPYRISSWGIARTFQNLQLFANMSVIENVMVGRHPRTNGGFLSNALRLPPAVAEEQAILDEAIKRLAQVGLEKKAFEPPSNLPLGQQKLLEVARALATDPHLLLLDEPAGGLSAQEGKELSRCINAIRENGVTVLLVEHRMEVVMGLADHVIVLNYGKKIAEGPPSEVQKDERVIAAYLGEEE